MVTLRTALALLICVVLRSYIPHLLTRVMGPISISTVANHPVDFLSLYLSL